LKARTRLNLLWAGIGTLMFSGFPMIYNVLVTHGLQITTPYFVGTVVLWILGIVLAGPALIELGVQMFDEEEKLKGAK
jgi:hypothetical protein